MIENNNLLIKIDEWRTELGNSEKHIHFAFLENFIEFEKFLTISFLNYALGEEGKDEYKPTRRIEFSDKEHFEGLLKCDKKYIDYIKKIQEVKRFIFHEDSCPFNKVFSSAEFMSHFKQMQVIRNYITHQSEESKNQYIKKVLEPNGIPTFIKVDTFLKRINRQQSVSNYSIYIESLKFHSEVICNPI
jgi:hypothetical protein